MVLLAGVLPVVVATVTRATVQAVAMILATVHLIPAIAQTILFLAPLSMVCGRALTIPLLILTVLLVCLTILTDVQTLTHSRTLILFMVLVILHQMEVRLNAIVTCHVLLMRHLLPRVTFPAICNISRM